MHDGVSLLSAMMRLLLVAEIIEGFVDRGEFSFFVMFFVYVFVFEFRSWTKSLFNR